MPPANPPQDPPNLPDTIKPVPLREALEERYLAYALSTIMGRALPDARDGLKPVHRRILYGMQVLRLSPEAAFRKCAKIVGDVMGSFHPHGDQAIYDALVRLAQDFSARYPLVEGQGNFGNIDGDNPAAYRYTEARMSEVARLLLDGIETDSVDFRDNYSGDDSEPIVLPAAFPNLLANGAQGIAVGMATSIPPHNILELCDASLHLIAHPKASSDDLLPFIKGPDFPTGGILVESAQSIAETYRTGRGAFRLRARWQREETGRGTYVVVVTEIPYGVQKSRLVEKLAELLDNKKLTLVGDIRDESAEDVRLVIEPRARNIDALIMMEQCFRLSELEVRIPLNMNVLVDGVVPRVVSLDEALRQWLDHRRNVLLRASRYRAQAIADRLEVLAGMLVVFLNLDEVIRIIREEDEPAQVLQRAFKLSERQVTYVLDTRLRALRRLEEEAIRTENAALLTEQAALNMLLSDPAAQWKQIANEVKALRKSFEPQETGKAARGKAGQTQNWMRALGARRTTFESLPEGMIEELDEALVEREPVTVVVSQKGWLRALKGHVENIATLAYKGDDALKTAFYTHTNEKLMLIATSGKAFTIEVGKIPGARAGERGSSKNQGEPVRFFVDLEEEADIFTILPWVAGQKWLFATYDGRGFVVPAEDLVSGTRKGRAVLVLEPEQKLAAFVPAMGDTVAVIGENRRLLLYPLASLPEMARGKGVRLQRYKDGGLSDIKVFTLAEGLIWRDSKGQAFQLAQKDLADWLGNRAEVGKVPPRGFPRANKFG